MQVQMRITVRNEWHEQVLASIAIFEALVANNTPFDAATFFGDFVAMNERHVAMCDAATVAQWAPIKAALMGFIEAARPSAPPP